MSEQIEDVYPTISAETRTKWRADAQSRGGIPHPADLDPHVRYLANRIVHLLDALDAVERDRDHWKDHAAEAGEGFARVCQDYARVSARNSEFVRRLEAWIRHGETVPADVTTYDRSIVHDQLRALIQETLTPPGAPS